MKHSLLLVEDEPLLCELFGEFVQTMEDIEYLGDARDGSLAMKKILEEKPDVIVLDLRIPEVNGLEILTLLRRKLPKTKIIIFTGSLSEETLRIALDHEASGYVEKAAGMEELSQAVEKAVAGEKHFSPGVARLMKNFRF